MKKILFLVFLIYLFCNYQIYSQNVSGNLSLIQHIGDGFPSCIKINGQKISISRTSVIQILSFKNNTIYDTLSSFDVGATINDFVFAGDTCFAATIDGLKIINFKDLSRPKIIGEFKYEAPEKILLYKNYVILFKNREFQIINISDFVNIQVVINSYNLNFRIGMIADALIKNDFLYLADYQIEWNGYIYIISLKDVTKPSIVSKIDPGDRGFDRRLGIYANSLVTNTISSLNVYDISDNTKPVLKNFSKNYYYFLGMERNNIYCFVPYGMFRFKIDSVGSFTDSVGINYPYYVSAKTGIVLSENNMITYNQERIEFIDISDTPGNYLINQIPVAGFAKGIAKYGNNVICSDKNNGFSIYDISKGTTYRGRAIGYYEDLKNISVYKSYLYQLSGDVSIYKMNINNTPEYAGSFTPNDYFNYKSNLMVSDSLLMFLGDCSLQIYSLKNPLSPQKINLPFNIVAGTYTVHDTILTVICDDTITVYSLKDISNINIIAELKISLGATYAFCKNKLLYVFWGPDSKMLIADISNPLKPKILTEKNYSINGYAGYIFFAKDNFMFYNCSSGGGIGVAQFDDKANVKESGRLKLSSSVIDFAVARDTLIVSTFNSGLWVLKIDTAYNAVSQENNTEFSYSLLQNFPNPFNPATTIKYSIPKEEKVKLTVYNLLGQKITELVNETKPAGNYEVVFDGKSLSSGVYLYRLQCGNFINTKKILLLK